MRGVSLCKAPLLDNIKRETLYVISCEPGGISGWRCVSACCNIEECLAFYV